MSKVLHIISNLMTGGAEAMLGKIVRATRSEIEHTVLSLINGGAIADEIAASGVPVHFLGARRSASAVMQLGHAGRAVRELGPDLIQGWMYHGNLIASAAASFDCRAVPVIWNVRQSLPRLRDEKLLTALAIIAGAPVSRQPQSIIYNSRRAAQDHEKLFYCSRRRTIIPNGFDLGLLRPDPAARTRLLDALPLPPNALIVGRVANFHRHKDFPTLMAAFDRIAKAEPRAHLVLVGRDVDSANIELATLLRTMSAPLRVHLMGERRDIAAIMPGFDLFVSSSSAEAFPNVIGEAMACGVPTITTDVGDCREILGDPGRVVPARNAQLLAAAALELLTLDRAARAEIGSRDRARVNERYSLAAVAAQYVALWQLAIRSEA